MARKNPLGKLKDLAKGAASVGMHVASQALRSATSTAGAVSKLVQGRKLTVAPAAEPATPAPKPAATTPEPVTSIDAAAHTRHVDATPADVAKAVAKKTPARNQAAKTASAAKQASARKTTPGAKLPPRKKVEQD